MRIWNYRSNSDFVLLSSKDWSGIQQGTDGYPKKCKLLDWYCIGGG